MKKGRLCPGKMYVSGLLLKILTLTLAGPSYNSHYTIHKFTYSCRWRVWSALLGNTCGGNSWQLDLQLLTVPAKDAEASTWPLTASIASCHSPPQTASSCSIQQITQKPASTMNIHVDLLCIHSTLNCLLSASVRVLVFLSRDDPPAYSPKLAPMSAIHMVSG